MPALNVSSMMLVDRGGHLPHDPNGRLLALGHRASGTWFGVSSFRKDNPLKIAAFARVKAMRLEERQGWLDVRTAEFPAGDTAGAAKAAMSIGLFYMEMDDVPQGREWLHIALAEAPLDDEMLQEFLRHNLAVLAQVEAADTTDSRLPTPAHSPSTSPEPAQHFAHGAAVELHSMINVYYNGQQGTLVSFTAAAGRWVVQLPTQQVSIRPINLRSVEVPDDIAGLVQAVAELDVASARA